MIKALVVATIVDFIAGFEINDIKILQDLGYEVHYAANCNIYGNEEKVNYLNSTEVIKHNVDFQRNPISKNNFKAYKQLSMLINKENFDVIHCHTPVGGVLTRLAAYKARKKGTKVIYTAHGFHFYKGAPLKNWLLYYPVEKFCSYFTDVIITINKEDYALAQGKMKANKIYYIPGVGVDIDKFKNCAIGRDEKRAEIGIPIEAKLLISVGELSVRKNHEVIVETLQQLPNDYWYVIVGKGILKGELESKDKTGRLKLLGFRTDIIELLHASDLFVFPSLQEGLPVALMEAMACGLPIACSRIRGNTDLIDEGKGGVMFDPKSVEDAVNALNKHLKSDLSIMGKYNSEKIKDFDLEKVKNEMKKIYECLN